MSDSSTEYHTRTFSEPHVRTYRVTGLDRTNPTLGLLSSQWQKKSWARISSGIVTTPEDTTHTSNPPCRPSHWDQFFLAWSMREHMYPSYVLRNASACQNTGITRACAEVTSDMRSGRIRTGGRAAASAGATAATVASESTSPKSGWRTSKAVVDDWRWGLKMLLLLLLSPH